MSEATRTWWYERDGQAAGPVEEAALLELVRSGGLRPEARVWRAGFAGWQPAGSVPELAAALPVTIAADLRAGAGAATTTTAAPPLPGAPAATRKYCPACGAQLDVRADVCPACGVRQPALARTDGRSKIAAGLFGILLGTLGVHKFYLGQVAWGLVYLLFCWSGIPTLLGLIEGIVYLSMSDEAFHAKYG